MEKVMISNEEAEAFKEFKRCRREEEIYIRLKKSVLDASGRDVDKRALAHAFAVAKKHGAGGVLVSPLYVALARRMKGDDRLCVACIAGGTGETLPAVKKYEAKKALSGGAEELFFLPSFSAIAAKNASFLKREIKKARKACKKKPFIVLLDDRSLDASDISFCAKLARECKADGVCVRGELALLKVALEGGGGLAVAVSHVENAEQFNSLLRAGASRVLSVNFEGIAGELLRTADRDISS